MFLRRWYWRHFFHWRYSQFRYTPGTKRTSSFLSSWKTHEIGGISIQVLSSFLLSNISINIIHPCRSMENLEIAWMIIPLAMQVAKPPISDWNSRTVSLLSRRPSPRLRIPPSNLAYLQQIALQNLETWKGQGWVPMIVMHALKMLKDFFFTFRWGLFWNPPKKRQRRLSVFRPKQNAWWHGVGDQTGRTTKPRKP